ncbi:MAG: putative motility protein [Hungatella sp.]|nr:putative motility protein [Hungatella sp.]
MEISSLSVAMPSGSINTGLDYVMLSKALDTVQDTGDALAKMMEAAVTGLGGQLDLMV